MEHNTCRENLSAYLDGELTPKERLEVETHLAGCPDCRAGLAGLKAVSGLVKAQAMEPVPPALKRAVLGKKSASFGWLKPALALSAAAAVVAVIVNVTGVHDNATMFSSGFGSRESADSGLYDLSQQSETPEEKSASDTGLASVRPQPASSPAPVWTAAAAGGAGTSVAAPAGAPARPEMESRVASVRGSLARAKASSAMPAAAPMAEEAMGKSDHAGYSDLPAGNAAADKPAAPREFRGPVCVYVSDPGVLREAERAALDALAFLRKNCPETVQSAPGASFLKNNGARSAVTAGECPYGFIFFDGNKDPLVVTDFSTLPARYRAYFGK